PALRIPIEEHPDAVLLGGIAKDRRALRAVLLSLLSALGREDLQETVDVLDLRRCQNHLSLLLYLPRRGRRMLRATIRSWAPRIGGSVVADRDWPASTVRPSARCRLLNVWLGSSSERCPGGGP